MPPPRRARGWVLPGYNYCGPFNPTDNGPPTNDLDRQCQIHDVAYGQYQKKGRNPYTHFNKADKRLIDNAGNSFVGKAIRSIFSIKGKIAPKLSFSQKKEMAPTPRKSKSRSRSPSKSKGSSQRSYSPMSISPNRMVSPSRSYSTRMGSSFGTRSRSAPPVARGRTMSRSPSRKRSRSRSRGVESNRIVGTDYSLQPLSGKRAKVAKYDANKGVKETLECGGTFQSKTQHCSYLGHGIARDKVMTQIARTLLKLLLKKALIPIANWQEKPEVFSADSYYIQIRYSKLENPAAAAFIQSYLDLAITWEANAITLLTAIQGAYTIYGEKIQWGNMQLVLGSTPVTPTNVDWPRAQLALDRLTLHLGFYSKMKIQNATVGSSVIALDPDVDTTINIKQNPLVGKVYTRRGRNGFEIERPLISGTAWNPQTGFASDAYGQITFDSQQINTNYQKPPPAYMWKATQAKNITLPPGAIRQSVISYNKSMNFQKLMDFLIYNWLKPNSYPLEFGVAEMIGVEKVLDDRNESLINTTLTWQLDATYTCYGTVKQDNRSQPIVYSYGTAIDFTGV